MTTTTITTTKATTKTTTETTTTTSMAIVAVVPSPSVLCGIAADSEEIIDAHSLGCGLRLNAASSDID